MLNSNFENESELLEEIKPLLNKETYVEDHTLYYYWVIILYLQKEYLKAKEFYTAILSINNLQQRSI